MSDPVVIIGGGVIGASIAWRIAARGRPVTLLDDERLGRASVAAAGMLAPVAEAWHGEEHLLALALASLERYPGFVAELEALTGIDVGFRRNGTLLIALDVGDQAELEHIAELHGRLGLASRWVTRRQARDLEPGLCPGIRGGLVIDGDHQIDPRRLLEALRSAVAASATLVSATVDEVVVGPDGVSGVRVGDRLLSASAVVLAGGAWSSLVPGVPLGSLPNVRPVKGQILRLAMDPKRPVIERTVRATVHGSSVYLVPRLSGELVIGATVEERGFDTTVTAGAVHDLLRDAIDLVPEVRECELVESWAGLRPGSPTNEPHIGPTDMPGLYVATGHHRNGILLTPITAEIVAGLICDGAAPRQVAALVSTAGGNA